MSSDRLRAFRAEAKRAMQLARKNGLAKDPATLDGLAQGLAAAFDETIPSALAELKDNLVNARDVRFVRVSGSGYTSNGVYVGANFWTWENSQGKQFTVLKDVRGSESASNKEDAVIKLQAQVDRGY